MRVPSSSFTSSGIFSISFSRYMKKISGVRQSFQAWLVGDFQCDSKGQRIFAHAQSRAQHEGADNCQQNQPRVLTDPFLPFQSAASLAIEKLAVTISFRSQSLRWILFGRAWRLIE